MYLGNFYCSDKYPKIILGSKFWTSEAGVLIVWQLWLCSCTLAAAYLIAVSTFVGRTFIPPTLLVSNFVWAIAPSNQELSQCCKVYSYLCTYFKGTGPNMEHFGNIFTLNLCWWLCDSIAVSGSMNKPCSLLRSPFCGLEARPRCHWGWVLQKGGMWKRQMT